MITRAMAWEQLNEMLDNQNLVKHCLAVEAAMADYAVHFDDAARQEEWSVAGLIHDADWEKFPGEHPGVIVTWLKTNGASGEMINAVEAHGFEFGIEPTSNMAKSLRAIDELTGLITAVALVKGRSLELVDVQSIKKKWAKKDFAAGVKREDIERGAGEIGVELDAHIENVLKSMKRVRGDLGL